MYRIRTALPSECADLTELAIRSKTHWGYSRDFMASCRAELTVSPEDLGRAEFAHFVAEQNGRTAGFAVLARRSSAEFELDALFVEPALIGHGVGSALMSHVLAYARGHDAQSILIQGDPHAAGFYESLGASLIGARESASIPGRFLPEYRLSL